MEVNTLFCLLVLASLSVGETAAGVTYSMKRNISSTFLSEEFAFYTKGNSTTSTCGIQCASNTKCISALNDERTNQCYLFTSALNVNISVETTEVTYIENEECTWMLPKQGDCCYTGNVDCLGADDHEYKDCQDAFDQGERDSGGTYFLRPEPTWRLIRAVCLFDSQSGWTVIQRRLDGSVDFFRGWDDYVDGFGDLNGEYWIGLEKIYYLTRENQKLSIYLEAHDGESRTANYSTFYIDDGSTDYVNHAGGYSGDAGDSWTYADKTHNNRTFATKDRDTSGGCSNRFKGGWWYSGCHVANLNGIWYEEGVVTEHATGTSWYTWKGAEYSYKTIYMRLGR